MTRASDAAALICALMLLCSCASEPAVVGLSTDLYLVELVSLAGISSVREPVNITDRPGYDNQPAFLADGSAILYVSRDGEDMGVYRYDFDSDSAERLTAAAPYRLYSPQPIPGTGSFAAVQARRSGELLLARFDAEGGSPEAIRPLLQLDVGYHAWLDDHTVAVRVESERPELMLLDLDGGELTGIVSDVGRSLQVVPGRKAISFVHKESPSEWWIKELDLETMAIRSLARTLQGKEDHAWLPSGTLLMGSGDRIYACRADNGCEWEEFASFEESDLGEISRIAVSPNGTRLVIVAERG